MKKGKIKMVGLGAVGGAVTALGGEILKLFKSEKDKEHEIRLLELQSKIKIAEKERDIIVEDFKTQSEMIISARQHDISLVNVSLWINNLRASVRPLVTYYCLIIATLFYFFGDTTTKQIIINSFTMLLEAIISFWFTGRIFSNNTKGDKQ